jgi:hypothetical protein
MEFISMRAFYLKNADEDSRNYYAFTRKMKRLLNDMGKNSGIKQINPTLNIVDTEKEYLYLPLLQKREAKIL